MRPLDLCFAFAPACLALGACGSSGAGATSTPAPGDASVATRASSVDAAAPEGGADVGGDDGAACVNDTLPLVVTTQSTPVGKAPQKLYVPATMQTQSVLFELDTGSTHTFLHEPLQDGGTTAPGDHSLDAGTAVIGCETLSLTGLGVSDVFPVNGETVAGTLGDDRLLTRPLQLDFVAKQVVWKQAGNSFPDTTSWPSTTYDRPFEYVRVLDLALDGTAVQLLLDTGSPDSIWLGQQGKPGDPEVDGEDADGNTIKMYLGTATLTFGGASARTIPVLRVPSFPYLQQLVDSLGGKLNGLFGLSAFAKGVVFDTDAKRVRVTP